MNCRRIERRLKKEAEQSAEPKARIEGEDRRRG
jgi:hypothetical protein